MSSSAIPVSATHELRWSSGTWTATPLKDGAGEIAPYPGPADATPEVLAWHVWDEWGEDVRLVPSGDKGVPGYWVIPVDC